MDIGPDAGHQLVPADQLAGALNQGGQDIESAAAETNRLVARCAGSSRNGPNVTARSPEAAGRSTVSDVAQLSLASDRSSRSCFAIHRSVVPNPSVKRRYTDASGSRAAPMRPWPRRSRARLIAVLSSHEGAP